MKEDISAATFDNVYVNGELYDNFDSNDLTEKINPTKWRTWEFIRGISGEELISALTQRGVNGSNNMSFVNSQAISEFAADLKVAEFQNSGARPQGRLYAAFYNDVTGNDTPGDLTGDVYGMVGILEMGSGPQAFYAVTKCTAPNCNLSNEYEILTSGIFKNVALNETHKFSLSWNGTNIILGCDGSPILYNPTSLATVRGAPKGRKGIGTRVSEIQNTTEWAYVSAKFENMATVVDTDGDGVPDSQDNCPTVYNPDQLDGDDDGIGDSCDLCPNVLNDGGPCPSSIGSGTASVNGPLINMTFTYRGPDTFLVPPNCNNVVFSSDPEIPQNCRFSAPYILTILEETPGANGVGRVGRPGGDWIPVKSGDQFTISCNFLDIFDESSLKGAENVTITPMYTSFFKDPGIDPNTGNCSAGTVCVDTSKYDLFQGTLAADAVDLTNTQNFKRVSIDIRPLTKLNVINLQSCGYFPVAIFGAPDFDVKTIDIGTIGMGGAGVKVVSVGKNKIPLFTNLYMNFDKLMDKVVFFDIKDIKAFNLPKDTEEICLAGKTSNGTSFVGCDSVKIISEKSWNWRCGSED